MAATFPVLLIYLKEFVAKWTEQPLKKGNGSSCPMNYTCENMFECFAHNMVRVKLSLCVMHPRGGERLYRKRHIPFPGTPLQYGPVQRVFAWLHTLTKILQTQMRMMARWWIMEFWGATADSLLQFGRARENHIEYKSTRRFRVKILHSYCGKHNWTLIQGFPTDRQIKIKKLRNWETNDVRTILR